MKGYVLAVNYSIVYITLYNLSTNKTLIYIALFLLLISQWKLPSNDPGEVEGAQ